MFALGCFLVIAKPAIRPTASIIIKIQPLISMLSFVCGDVLIIGLLFYYCFFWIAYEHLPILVYMGV